jgi:hypothetical protein
VRVNLVSRRRLTERPVAPGLGRGKVSLVLRSGAPLPKVRQPRDVGVIAATEIERVHVYWMDTCRFGSPNVKPHGVTDVDRARGGNPEGFERDLKDPRIRLRDTNMV